MFRSLETCDTSFKLLGIRIQIGTFVWYSLFAIMFVILMGIFHFYIGIDSVFIQQNPSCGENMKHEKPKLTMIIHLNRQLVVMLKIFCIYFQYGACLSNVLWLSVF